MPVLGRFPSRDTFLDSANPATNQGANQGINNGVLTGKTPTLYHGLFMFDFGLIVGIAATITSASFGFYVNSTAGTGGAQHSLNRIVPARQNWTEMGATWNTYDGVNAWTTPGGDFDAIIPPFVWVPTGNGFQVVPGGTTLVALLQDAINNWNGQLHLLWKQVTEAGPPANSIVEAIASREDINLPATSHWPIIQASYTAPAAKRQTRILNVTGDLPQAEMLRPTEDEFIDWP